MQVSPSAEPLATQDATRRLVARNTLLLTVSQAATVPLSVLANALTARFLGAESFGYLYLAGTFAGFGMLAVGWGHEGVLPAMVAQDRSIAGVLLGSSFAWRAATSVVVYAVLATLCHLLGYNAELQWALGLSFVSSVLTSFVAACKDTIRGFERADIPAYVHVGQQLLGTCLLAPALFFGGRMRAVLLVGNVTVSIVLIWILGSLRKVGVGKLSVGRTALRSLFIGGTPFVFVSLALALQPLIDAAYLAKFGSVEAVGWYAVARKLIGLLLFPASALIGALYPTLCRLWVEDRAEFLQVTRGSLHSVSLLVMPIALGCFLFPDVGVSIFSKQAYGPAADDLRILSVFLFLVYFTMPIGTCVLAAGKQRAWSIVQSLCVAVSIVFDPLLTRWFQQHYANGGLGPSVTSVASEVIVVGCGLWFMPSGVFDSRLRRTLLFTALSGAAMAAVAWLLRSITPFVAAPVGVLAYGAALWATGQIDRSHVAKIVGVIRRRLSPAR
ncbi:MAG: oligosaccharide flippase family protein [Pseudomonadota bacterium]